MAFRMVVIGRDAIGNLQNMIERPETHRSKREIPGRCVLKQETPESRWFPKTPQEKQSICSV